MKPALRKVGRNAFACIRELVDALDVEACDDIDAATEAIHADALSIGVRRDWEGPGDSEPGSLCEYRILLSTGGPATRIVGDLENGEPTTATLEVQDWGTPWTPYPSADEQVLLAYARVFYWGEP